MKLERCSSCMVQHQHEPPELKDMHTSGDFVTAWGSDQEHYNRDRHRYRRDQKRHKKILRIRQAKYVQNSYSKIEWPKGGEEGYGVSKVLPVAALLEKTMRKQVSVSCVSLYLSRFLLLL